ncbi:MAG: endonuclease/exonuclease/phosphatase family protein [Clostridia bacterium]|nr:endonuclease/exonuclease/phosphatase family protein [Clostridia bacterium]
MKIKTATYNIHNGFDVKYDYSILAEDILNEGAEIVALEEVDQFTARNGNKDTMAILSEKTGYKYYKFAAAIDYKGGEYGIAILSKHPIADTEIISLPTTREGEEKRKCLHAKIDVNGSLLDYFAAHCDQKSIREQLSKINESTSKCPVFVLAGDFNVQESEKFSVISNSYSLNNAPTKIITTADNYSFDNFVLSNGIKAEKVYAKNTKHSDHYIFVCELSIPLE